MTRHDWRWQRPSYGLKQCTQCGVVESIRNHKKVGECKGRICDKCNGTGYIKEEQQ